MRRSRWPTRARAEGRDARRNPRRTWRENARTRECENAAGRRANALDRGGNDAMVRNEFVRRRAPALLALLATLLVARPAESGAQDAEPAAHSDAPPSEWTFQVIPYLWLPEVQGTVGTRGR